MGVRYAETFHTTLNKKKKNRLKDNRRLRRTRAEDARDFSDRRNILACASSNTNYNNIMRTIARTLKKLLCTHARSITEHERGTSEQTYSRCLRYLKTILTPCV